MSLRVVKPVPEITEQDIQRTLGAIGQVEDALLGVVLSSGDRGSTVTRSEVEAALAMVEVQDFTTWQHRDIWQAIKTVHAAGNPPNLILVHTELVRTGRNDDLARSVDLADCVGRNGLWHEFAPYLARIVRTAALHRRLADAAERGDADGISEATQSLAALGVVEASDEFPTMREVADSYFDMIGDESTSVVRVGIGGLDRTTGGFRPGNLITIGARPAVGKSALGITMAYNLAVRQTVPVGFISLEMSTYEITQRLLAIDAGVSTQESRQMTDAVATALGRVSDAPLYIRRPGSKLSDVLAAAGPLVSQHGCQTIIIDYLQLMSSGGSDNRAQDIAAITRELKNWAVAQAVPVIVLAQLKRDTSGIPKLEDLAEGDAPARDSDVVLLLHPDDEHAGSMTQPVEMIIAKHRNGPVGRVALQFVKKTTRFTETEWS